MRWPRPWTGAFWTPKEETMGAILELTSYAATPFGMVAIIVVAALAYFAARWVFSD
jgi:hypothetical protein